MIKECKQMGAILVVMGNGLWLPHKTGNQAISLANKIQPSPGVLEYVLKGRSGGGGGVCAQWNNWAITVFRKMKILAILNSFEAFIKIMLIFYFYFCST